MSPQIVLVTDDNSITLTILKKLCQELLPNHAVLVAPSPKHFYGILELNHPSLVITDVLFFDPHRTLPENQATVGLDFVTRIRTVEQDSNLEVPSIVIVVSASPEYKAKALNHGADAFLVKPVKKDDLARLLRVHGLLA